MKRLRRKLDSQSGAALLLAFLMLLLCIMVASSVLAAAASNAGRIKSNRIEQQKYMTLTSAVQLVCDDLKKANYKAEYEKYEWTTASGDAFHIKQISGDCSGSTLGTEVSSGGTKSQIPLKEWLDQIFFGNGKAGYKALTPPVAEYSCDLKVILPDKLKGYPYKAAGSPQEIYQVDQTVTVQVKIDQATQNITLTAWLGEGSPPAADDVRVTAELAARKDPFPFINPHGTTGSAMPDLKDGIPENTLPLPGYTNQTATVTLMDGTIATFTTIKKETLTSMTWELNWIKKGE